jgi:hypothetical protein
MVSYHFYRYAFPKSGFEVRAPFFKTSLQKAK